MARYSYTRDMLLGAHHNLSKIIFSPDVRAHEALIVPLLLLLIVIGIKHYCNALLGNMHSFDFH